MPANIVALDLHNQRYGLACYIQGCREESFQHMARAFQQFCLYGFSQEASFRVKRSGRNGRKRKRRNLASQYISGTSAIVMDFCSLAPQERG